MKLLATRKNVYLVEDNNGHIRTLLKDTYSQAKLTKFDGNRIFYKFDDVYRVEETYDERVFNCYMNDAHLVIRDGEKIAEFILDNNRIGFEVFFKERFYQHHKTEFIDEIIRSYGDRVVKVPDGYVIDDIWKVNNHGSSYVKQKGWKGHWDHYDDVQVHGEHAKGLVNDWHFICTVAQGKLMKMNIDSEIGELELDEITMTIMGKVNFFMNPNVEDSVFMNQLPKELQKVLKDEAKDKDGGVLQ